MRQALLECTAQGLASGQWGGHAPGTACMHFTEERTTRGSAGLSGTLLAAVHSFVSLSASGALCPKCAHNDTVHACVHVCVCISRGMKAVGPGYWTLSPVASTCVCSVAVKSLHCHSPVFCHRGRQLAAAGKCSCADFDGVVLLPQPSPARRAS